jgi:hypothetical protein
MTSNRDLFLRYPLKSRAKVKRKSQNKGVFTLFNPSTGGFACSFERLFKEKSLTLSAKSKCKRLWQ